MLFPKEQVNNFSHNFLSQCGQQYGEIMSQSKIQTLKFTFFKGYFVQILFSLGTTVINKKTRMKIFMKVRDKYHRCAIFGIMMAFLQGWMPTVPDDEGQLASLMSIHCKVIAASQFQSPSLRDIHMTQNLIIPHWIFNKI